MSSEIYTYFTKAVVIVNNEITTSIIQVILRINEFIKIPSLLCKYIIIKNIEAPFAQNNRINNISIYVNDSLEN